MKILAILFLASGMMSLAQSLPSQFAGLSTDPTDWTCAGSTPCATFPTPAGPDWGGTYSDPIWGTTIKRVSKPIHCIDADPCAPTQRLYPDYPKAPPWNIDGSLMLLVGDAGWFHIYDGVAYTDLGRIQMSGPGMGLSSDHDVRWANSTNVTDAAHTIFFDTNTFESADQCSLYSYNTQTLAVTKLVQPVGTGYTCQRLWSGNEGNWSNDDRYFASFMWMTPANFAAQEAIVYDRVVNQIVGQASMATICGGACGSAPNWIGMSPNGTYVIINWNAPGVYNAHARGTGTELFDKQYQYLGEITAYNGHGDTTLDTNGKEVYVARTLTGAGSGLPIDYFRLGICDLSTVATGGCALNQTSIVLCNYVYNNPNYPACTGVGNIGSAYPQSGGQKTYHLSGRAMSGAARGWMLFSTFDGNAPNPGSQGTGWGSAELVAIKIDSTVTPNTNATFRRIGRDFDIHYGSSTEAHGSVNRDFTKMVFASDWLVFNGQSSAYVIELAGNKCAIFNGSIFRHGSVSSYCQ